MCFLDRLYRQDFTFTDFTMIESLLINIFQEVVNRLEDFSYNEKMDEFIVEFLEGWFLSTQNNEDVNYLRETLEEMVLEAEIGGFFLIAEEE